MKSTETFKQTIMAHLQSRAATDPLFAKSFAKEAKNIDDCINYIFSKVQKSGCNGFTDDEIYSMAVHYYDEDDIKVGKPTEGRVVVNHHIELTPEEIKEAKEEAIRRTIEAEQQRLRMPIAHKKVEPVNVSQPTLF